MFNFGRLGDLGCLGGVDPFFWVLSSGGVKATLDIDFVNDRAKNGALAPSISSLLTYSGGIAGRKYTNADGTLKTTGTSIPYGTNGLLVEEARTNLEIRSQEFDNASWTPVAASISANAVAAPDGTLTADKLIESATTAEHYLIQSLGIPLVNGSTYTFSCFAKAAERSVFILRGAGAFAADPRVRFDLGAQTATVDNGTPTATITALANGWFLCTMTAVTNATEGTCYHQIYNGAHSYAGDGTSGLYIWGSQVELGGFVTSYIPTTTGSVTRAADVVTLATSGFSFNAATGTVYSQQTAPPVNGTQVVWQLDDGTADERMLTWRSTATITRSVVDGGVDQVAIGTDTIAVNTLFRHSLAYQANNFACSIDGAAVRTDGAGTIPTVTTLRFGRDHSANYWNSYIKRLAYFNSRIADGSLPGIGA